MILENSSDYQDFDKDNLSIANTIGTMKRVSQILKQFTIKQSLSNVYGLFSLTNGLPVVEPPDQVLAGQRVGVGPHFVPVRAQVDPICKG
jgi:hypothetical protein